MVEDGKRTLLIVDDVELNRAILCEIFREEYHLLEAVNGKEALEQIAAHEDIISAVLLDVVMPIMDGFEVLEVLCRQEYVKKVPVFLITSEYTEAATMRGYEMGVMDVIGKPIVPHIAKRRIESVIELYHIRNQLNDRVLVQEQKLDEKTKEIQELNHAMIETLATAIEFRDCESGEHVRRIHDLTMFFLDKTEFGAALDENEKEEIATAAIMHDVGKIAIFDHILNKPGKLTPEEFCVMKTHTIRGCELLDQIPKINQNSLYRYAYDICRHHHERWDGRGYPDGISGEDISPWSQVVGLADVYDALTSERVYKRAYSHEKAVEMILGGECGQFNPKLLTDFCALSSEIRMLMKTE